MMRSQITPSIMYQNSRKHDVSNYWPAYSNVAAGQFNNGTPERIPVPDKYYLPAIKIVADIGKTQLISNTSYYNRDETDRLSRVGLRLRLLSEPELADRIVRLGLDHPGSALLLVSAHRCQGRALAGRIRRLRHPQRHHQPAGILDAGNPLAIER